MFKPLNKVLRMRCHLQPKSTQLFISRQFTPLLLCTSACKSVFRQHREFREGLIPLPGVCLHMYMPHSAVLSFCTCFCRNMFYSLQNESLIWILEPSGAFHYHFNWQSKESICCAVVGKDAMIQVFISSPFHLKIFKRTNLQFLIPICGGKKHFHIHF